MSIRPVKQLRIAKPTLEGAGVRLRRAFGFGNTSEFDPFLARYQWFSRITGTLMFFPATISFITIAAAGNEACK